MAYNAYGRRDVVVPPDPLGQVRLGGQVEVGPYLSVLERCTLRRSSKPPCRPRFSGRLKAFGLSRGCEDGRLSQR